jgi:hypothetical protein
MAAPFLILLPPSEGKAVGGDGPPLDLESLSFGELGSARTQMIKAVGRLSEKPRVAQKTLGVKGVALEKARTDNSEVLGAPTMPAIERYTGVMYDSIDYASLDETAKEVFGENTVIMSGLFGAVRPFDMIPTYKLKMGATVRGKKSCATVWKPLITKSLAPVALGRIIWDLLPNEHNAAWDPSKVGYERRYTIKFLEADKDGQMKTVNHWSKALKGALVRFLVANPDLAGSAGSVIDLLKNFSHPEGYEFRADLTTESGDATQLIFLKDFSS